MNLLGADAVAPSVTIDVSIPVFVMMYGITFQVFPDIDTIFRDECISMVYVLIYVLRLDPLYDFRRTTGEDLKTR